MRHASLPGQRGARLRVASRDFRKGLLNCGFKWDIKCMTVQKPPRLYVILMKFKCERKTWKMGFCLLPLLFQVQHTYNIKSLNAHPEKKN